MKRRTEVLLLCPAGVLLVGVLLILMLNVWMVERTESRIVSESPGQADCILVLGCGIHADGTPTPMLRDRLKTGARLYREGWADKVLLSGDDSGADYNELAVMERVTLELNVPSEAILCDHAGFSTCESLLRARDVYGMKRVIVVTQTYHLYRALYLADALGLEAWGVSADLQEYSGMPIWEGREVAARVKAVLMCLCPQW